jgi:uncharacterized protein
VNVVGLDLAGSPRRTTGYCAMDQEFRASTLPLHTDQEILDRTLADPVDLVTIDAPLSLPRGRRSLAHRSGPHFRECDLELRRRHIPFFPLTLGPMRTLTARGMRLKAALRLRGLEALESYPGGAQDVLGMPRKSAGNGPLRRALVRFGVSGLAPAGRLTHDELDAVTSALVGVLWLQGKAIAIGDPEEGQILLPKPDPGRPRQRTGAR